MTLPSLPRQFGLPLAMQLIAILVCALLAAQLVTLGLTVLLPPEPSPRWNMDEVAAALNSERVGDRLERKEMAGPPDVEGQGWLVSQSSRDALAQRLGRSPNDVILAFYTALPVGGVAVPSDSRSPLAIAAPAGSAKTGGLASLLVETANAQSIPGGPPPGGGNAGPGGLPGGGFPGGRMPGGSFPGGPGPGSSFPGGGTISRPGGLPGGGLPSRPGGGAIGGGIRMPTHPSQPQQTVPGGRPAAPGNPSGAAPGNTAGGSTAGKSSGTTPGNLSGAAGRSGMESGMPHAGPAMPMNGPSPATAPLASSALVASNAAASSTNGDSAKIAAITQTRAAATAVRIAPATTPVIVYTDSTVRTGQTSGLAKPRERLAAATPAVNGTPQPVPFRRETNSLFELASPPFIEGDFIAAARQPDGKWLAVAPRTEPFPNVWQKRVMLWFALSLAIVSPLAWLFARRIVVPLRDFARAAEQLGRDPSATILPLSGPAEIGRAANAFNQMRNRLRSFVDDRTAMVGAISHDLRTPLTRLRFRIEDVPDEQRGGLLREVSEMEDMISQVIAFIRDASTPGPRQRVDFADLVAGSVADARLVGANVEIEHNANIPVDVDPVGIRRLLGNLLENAVKYGESARVRVSLREGEAMAEIIDAGPGIPEDEFDRAFEPFYRSETARSSGRNGSGLGLTVCRSIARAHGGDVSFSHAGEGFVARVTVPAAFNPTLRKAA